MYFFKIIDASMVIGLSAYSLYDKDSEGGALVGAFIYLILRHLAANCFEKYIHNDPFYRVVELAFFFALLWQSYKWMHGGPLLGAFVFGLLRYCWQEVMDEDSEKPKNKAKSQ